VIIQHNYTHALFLQFGSGNHAPGSAIDW